jgi:hypothetical protein
MCNEAMLETKAFDASGRSPFMYTRRAPTGGERQNLVQIAGP